MAPKPREQLTDAVRVLARLRRDSRAWETVFAVSWPTALATTHRILGGQLELAEDAAQEAYKRLVRYCDFGKLSDADAFLAYLQTVCRNVALDLRRELSESRERQPVDEELSELDLSGTAPDPERSMRETELRRKLQQDLNVDDRKLFALMLEQRSLTEIASKLGVSYSAAGVRVHRLRLRLRKRLTEL